MAPKISYSRDSTGAFTQLDNDTREWLRSRKIPGTTTLCCNEADGVWAEEDTINGRYWTRWRIDGALTAWMPVPPEVVIHGNKHGSPVVWWLWVNGHPVIRCYAPGAGT